MTLSTPGLVPDKYHIETTLGGKDHDDHGEIDSQDQMSIVSDPAQAKNGWILLMAIYIHLFSFAHLGDGKTLGLLTNVRDHL